MKYNFSTYNPKDINSINEPVFELQHVRRDFYGHFYIQPAYISQNSKDENEIRFYGDYVHTGEVILSNLNITCQYGTTLDSSVGDKIRQPYAFDCEYKYASFSVCNMEASQYRIKFLSKLEKAYTRMCDEEGQPETFAEYVLYFARIMSIKTFVIRHSDNTFACFNKSEFRHWINDKINGN